MGHQTLFWRTSCWTVGSSWRGQLNRPPIFVSFWQTHGYFNGIMNECNLAALMQRLMECNWVLWPSFQVGAPVAAQQRQDALQLCQSAERRRSLGRGYRSLPASHQVSRNQTLRAPLWRPFSVHCKGLRQSFCSAVPISHLHTSALFKSVEIFMRQLGAPSTSLDI